MRMKPSLIIVLIVTFAAMFMVGCGDDDKILESQRTSIERYLTSSHNPRLIPQSEVENSITYNPPFYQKFGLDIYRYISTYYNQGRDKLPEVTKGDEVELIYTAYDFKGSAPSVSNIYATNDVAKIDELVKAGLNAEYWSEEPVKIKIGNTEIIKGVEVSLLGCREGDVVEVYMTQKAAYDNKGVGIVVKDSPVMWTYTITRVLKK